jgi:phosphoenolpyruvate carboxykinase (GTP)
VTQAFNWEHGVFLGSIMASETTAAQQGAVGNLRFDPMAMLPFCGYNMADYFGHWLALGAKADAAKLPQIFFVNWFRRDEDGRFLWPGYGENSRAIGMLPAEGSLDVAGLKIDDADMKALLSIDSDGWKAAIPQIKDHYAQFGAKLPAKLTAQLDTLASAL